MHFDESREQEEGATMRLWDTKVETPYPLADIEDRDRDERRAEENQCSSCGLGESNPWFSIDELTIVRHWTEASIDEPGGGHWTIHCPEHSQAPTRWWKNSHLAPAHLLPKIQRNCEKVGGLKYLCGKPAVEPFDNVWLCDEHASVERMNRRAQDLFADE